MDEIKIDIIIERINEQCDRLNISVNKMLTDCNLNKSVVDNLKKGSLPSIEKISKIASYFNVTTDYLLGKETLDQQLEGIDFALQSETEDLTEEQKQSVLDFVQFIKNKDKK